VSINRQTALQLAAQGYYVFPCQEEGGSKKSPHKGVYWRSVSTTDPDKISRLWQKHPDAVPGIDLAKCNLLVIDCDKKPADGLAWLTHYAEQFNDPLNVPYSDTPSGGRHLFYRNPTEHNNARGRLPPKHECGIDVRGMGGFVIGPGSIFTDTMQAYVLHGLLTNAQDPPPWLLELLSPHQQSAPQPIALLPDDRLKAYGEAAFNEILEELKNTPQGERNNQANALAFRAGQLVGGECLDLTTTRTRLWQAASSWGIKPYDKALGPKGTIARALQDGIGHPKGPSDSLPSGVVIDLPQLAAAPPAPTSNPKEAPTPSFQVPGLVGAIAKWICDTAMYPQPALSLGAALTIVGTAAGRHIAGPTRSGTHLYVIGIARTGAGKNHPLSQIGTILQASGMGSHVGPSQFISMPAVINFLVREPLSVCAMDEFGAFLKRVNNKRASGFEGAVSSVLRMAWGNSFTTMTTPEWAQLPARKIESPAMSIFGTSTAGEFYTSLEGADIVNGILNRFLIIESPGRPAKQTPQQDPARPPEGIVHGLRAIYGRLGGAMNKLSASSPSYVSLAISDVADTHWNRFAEELQNLNDQDEDVGSLMARTAEIAMRLATIVTVGLGTDCIEIDVMTWACEFARWSANKLVVSAGLYIADSEHQAMANDIKRTIGRLSNGSKRVRHSDLIQALKYKYKSRDLKEALEQLIVAGSIKAERQTPEGGGPPTFWYR
jgi:hypothetical protein